MHRYANLSTLDFEFVISKLQNSKISIFVQTKGCFHIFDSVSAKLPIVHRVADRKFGIARFANFTARGKLRMAAVPGIIGIRCNPLKCSGHPSRLPQSSTGFFDQGSCKKGGTNESGHRSCAADYSQTREGFIPVSRVAASFPFISIPFILVIFVTWFVTNVVKYLFPSFSKNNNTINFRKI